MRVAGATGQFWSSSATVAEPNRNDRASASFSACSPKIAVWTRKDVDHVVEARFELRGGHAALDVLDHLIGTAADFRVIALGRLEDKGERPLAERLEVRGGALANLEIGVPELREGQRDLLGDVGRAAVSELDPANIGHGNLEEAVLRDEFDLFVEEPDLQHTVVDALHLHIQPRRAANAVGRRGIGGRAIGTVSRTDDESGGQCDREHAGEQTCDGHGNALLGLDSLLQEVTASCGDRGHSAR
jgi:hypothetical protein